MRKGRDKVHISCLGKDNADLRISTKDEVVNYALRLSLKIMVTAAELA